MVSSWSCCYVCSDVISYFSIIHLVAPGLYLRRIMETSEVDGNDTILLCQYLRWFNNGTIHLDEVTYLNGDNCTVTNAEVVWTQFISADSVSSSQVGKDIKNNKQRA